MIVSDWVRAAKVGDGYQRSDNRYEPPGRLCFAVPGMSADQPNSVDSVEAVQQPESLHLRVLGC